MSDQAVAERIEHGIPETARPEMISIDRIVEGRNHRNHAIDIAELAMSIKEVGLLQPILVREVGSGEFRVVCGFRRLAACKVAGLKEIPCLIKPMNDLMESSLNLAENVSRVRPNPIEIAHRLQELYDTGQTQQEIANQMGKSIPWVSQHLRLLQLPQAMQERVAAFEVGVTTALKGGGPGSRRKVEFAGESGKDAEELQELRAFISKKVLHLARKQAKKNRQTFESFVEENLVIAIDWKVFGEEPPPSPYVPGPSA